MTATSTPAHLSVPALPDGYRMAELDDAADRPAMAELDGWAFAYELTPEDEAAQVWDLEPGRSVGVWDERGGHRLVAMHASRAFALQVPGGRRLPTAGLTWVGVHPGHRRRGLARAMVTTHLRRSIDRGEVLSALTAAETGIYGRYGYGVATQFATLNLGRGVTLREVPGSEDMVVELEVVDAARHSELLEQVHRAVVRPGWITRDTPALRAAHLVDWPSARRETEALRIAVVRDPQGEPRGYALFRRREKWSEARAPEGTVRVRESVALDAAAARALWGTLSDLDLMASVATGPVATDDAVVHLVADLRGAELRLHDDVWVRILDVPAALGRRSYQGPVDVVLEVVDELVPANAGRWHLRGGPAEAHVERTDAPADLSLDVADLASAYLGGTSLGALAAAGRVRELSPGTLTAASAGFGWPLAPANSWPF